VFNLVEQLKQKNISLEEAAKKSGLSVARLKDIADGKEFSLHELRVLSKKLLIPLSDFMSNPPKEPEIEVLFRKTLNRENEKDQPIIYSLSKEVANVIELASGLPPNVAWIDMLQKTLPDNSDIEQLTQFFRALFCDGDQEGPLNSLPEIVSERLDVTLLVVPNLPVEGASVRYENQAFIFIAPRKFQPRMLFTLAHEVGHFVAGHHGNTENFATFDSDTELLPWRKQKRHAEEFANHFASALLLPASSVGKVLKSIRKTYQLEGELGDIEISYLARFFGVSFEVAGRRCENLGLLPDFGARVLYERVCEEYKNPERRADDAGLPRRTNITFLPPRRLIHAASRRIKAGEISTGRVSETLHVSLADLFSANAESEG